MIVIDGVEVFFVNATVEFKNQIKMIETDMHFITIASATAKDVLVEDYEFTEPVHVINDHMMHRLIKFTLPPGTLQEIIYKISRIYVEVLKNYSKEAEVCCKGWEYLYLKKLFIFEGNLISMGVVGEEARHTVSHNTTEG